ncbi:ABC transporter [Crepidotus variabilis]|uniref:ABC transporter n=1 Tax=Crepidotus variabilis TaxID=179855 RepID=A0A9P6E5Y9_9AGAR|nr:ABC transporter [Crepidotus variabilis]
MSHSNEKRDSLDVDEKESISAEVVDTEKGVQQKKSSRFWPKRKPPPPPPASLDDAKLIPEATANFFSLLTFQWVTPLLSLGYARPLEAPDLWALQEDRSAKVIARKINESWDRRVKAAAEYNEKLTNGEVKPGLKGLWWSIQGKRAGKEKEWREKTGKRKASLVKAMDDSVKWWFWSGGALKVVGDTAQVTSPLVVKAIINFAGESYANHKAGLPTPGIGRGVGLAFALFILQIVSSICTNIFFYRAASTGVLIRGGLITAIYNRSLRLTARARSTLPNGKLVNHISTDVSRIDFCAGFFHMSWTAPIQLGICLALLIVNLGPSALAGFAVFVLGTPLQTYVMKTMFKLRAKAMQWTDKRVKLLQELFGGMKVIKFFAWEVPYLDRLAGYRKSETSYIRSLLLIRSANNAVAMSMPIIASVVAFIIYSVTGHPLQPAIIFSSLTLFNLLRMPLMFLPVSLSAIADAQNAVERLRGVFEAELLEDTIIIDEQLDNAIEVQGASFTWDAPPPEAETKASKKKSGPRPAKPTKEALAAKKAEADQKAKGEADNVFEVRDINLVIPRGQLVAIVGAVGSGKSSLLQGLIGEMRKKEGKIAFGGSVAYCPQSAWIQNATIRDNVCFGRPFEEERYWKAVRDSCLMPDLAMLPNADLTEVGEKGISLSGGQKQRLNICRAIYCDTEIQIFDDPLSALDAHVGKEVFWNVFKDVLKGKTRVLVTHALHFLKNVDYVYVVDGGRVVEGGTYKELMEKGNNFSKFVTEFGAKDEDESQDDAKTAEGEVVEETKEDKKQPEVALVKTMMQAEERNTGAVSWDVYKAYLKAARGEFVLPLLIIAALSMQASMLIGSYWLVWWQQDTFHQPQGFYMGIYAGLGVGQAFATFFVGACFALFTYFSSQKLHRNAITHVLHAPMSFFDTTPLGRIMNRFSKDIDNIDNMLGESLRMFTNTMTSIIGAIVLISIVLPWFLIGVFSILIVYYYAAAFYRASARELKRLDAILRSSLYSHFSESLSGLTTIRAYGESERFLRDNEKFMDIENRAYWMTVTNQRWLGIRLDFLGGLLTFIVAMLTVGTRFTISPSQTGVVLSYILSVQQAFGWMVRQSAEVENNMNSVERIVYYTSEVEHEAAYEIPEKKPAPTWPAEGHVELKDIVLSYRPGLPAVLKGISMDVAAGEKIGIVGRTGAGKSSIMTALFRMVEISSGSIVLDGVDISTIGLADLRKALAIIPQDPLLFSGTLRTNLDPFGVHDDASLWDALKRVYLVGSTPFDTPDPEQTTGTSTPTADHPQQGVRKFTLDMIIEDEGNNLSVGQRSLVSLARALVKNSRVIILDEATASVDYETDSKIQETIAHEFYDRTVLCIAHRLRTIISYDRICVLDAGQVAEFDTPSNLYTIPDGIFRGMCDRSSITLTDIQLARKGEKEELA